MGRVLAVSCVLGALSVVETFGLLFIGMHNLNQVVWGVTIDASHISTMMFLQLVVGGHLMLFVTRTRKMFFMTPWPSGILFMAILGTQLFAALMCGFGWLVAPLPWALIGLVWVYNLVWMFAQDIAKLIVYRILEGKATHCANFLKRVGSSLQHHAHLHSEK